MPSQSGAERKALKAIGNLTTSISCIKFNHDSQLVALASTSNKDALKLVSPTSPLRPVFLHCRRLIAVFSLNRVDIRCAQVHLPSATVYSNWPTQQTPLHHVTAVDFSRGSEWLAVGNKRGKVLLYSLKQFTR